MLGNRKIPENEIRLVYVRSSGAGGQNVNKVSTKAQLHWDLMGSAIFDASEKAKLRAAFKNRLTNEGEIVLTSSEQRTQAQNRETALEKLYRLIDHTLTPQAKRIPTRPTWASQLRKRDSKERRTNTKRLRKNIV
ncbi:TPA: aminoacyl-tRNA hydrolase [Candidatus Uhrbacteria bacterium]|nr:aminoacyl-tRNA hydrolase [Candidatus Uhrbacteria bacterium]